MSFKKYVDGIISWGLVIAVCVIAFSQGSSFMERVKKEAEKSKVVVDNCTVDSPEMIINECGTTEERENKIKGMSENQLRRTLTFCAVGEVSWEDCYRDIMQSKSNHKFLTV